MNTDRAPLFVYLFIFFFFHSSLKSKYSLKLLSPSSSVLRIEVVVDSYCPFLFVSGIGDAVDGCCY